jgi:hypothetical protein
MVPKVGCKKTVSQTLPAGIGTTGFQVILLFPAFSRFLDFLYLFLEILTFSKFFGPSSTKN